MNLSCTRGISRELNTRGHVEGSAVTSRAGNATSSASLVVHIDTGARVEVQATVHERDGVCGGWARIERLDKRCVIVYAAGGRRIDAHDDSAACAVTSGRAGIHTVDDLDGAACCCCRVSPRRDVARGDIILEVAVDDRVGGDDKGRGGCGDGDFGNGGNLGAGGGLLVDAGRGGRFRHSCCRGRSSGPEEAVAGTAEACCIGGARGGNGLGRASSLALLVHSDSGSQGSCGGRVDQGEGAGDGLHVGMGRLGDINLSDGAGSRCQRQEGRAEGRPDLRILTDGLGALASAWHDRAPGAYDRGKAEEASKVSHGGLAGNALKERQI